MTMGIQQQYGVKVGFLNKSFKFFFFFGKIKTRVNNAALPFFVIKDIGIFFNGIKTESLDG
jgi:hypothetical protein